MKTAVNRAAKRALRTRIGAVAVSVAAVGALLTGCTSGSGDVEVPKLADGKLPAELTSQMEAAVSTAVTSVGGSGAIVGVWVPWSGAWVAGVGTTKTGGSTEVTPEMSFRIGDITREMTCDALYGMARDGIVELGDPVSDYVAGVGEKEGVTLKMLCDGTSGIAPVAPAIRAEMLANPDRDWKPRELAAFGLGSPVTSAPGEKFARSDTGYLLLGTALDRASDTTASEYFRTYVTDPLGLKNTALPGAAPAVAKPAPNLPGQIPMPIEGGVNCAEPTDFSEISASMGYTDSGATSTITDLGTYAAAVAKNALGEDGDGRFKTKLPGYNGAPTWYSAAGGSLEAGSMIGQWGSIPGYSTAAFSDPKTGVTVAVVVNSSARASLGHDIALQLAAMASKAPAASGKKATEMGLPWTAEGYGDAITKNAVCPVG